MFIIFEDFWGNYCAIEDTTSDIADELLGGIVGYFAFGLLVLSPITVGIFFPSLMTPAFASIFIGLLLILYGRGNHTLGFLYAMAPFFLHYGVISLCKGIWDGAIAGGSTLGFLSLMAAISIPCILIAGIMVSVNPLGDLNIPVGLLFFIGSFLAWWLNGTIKNNWLYLFRVTTLISLIVTIRAFFFWIKKGIHIKAMLHNIFYILVGILPIALADILKHKIADTTLLIIFIASYGLIGYTVSKIEQIKKQENGHLEFIILPFLLVNLFYFSANVTFVYPSVVMDYVINFLHTEPISTSFSLIAREIAVAFATQTATLLHAAINLVLLIFDSSISKFSLPPFAGIVVGFVVISIACGIGKALCTSKRRRISK